MNEPANPQVRANPNVQNNNNQNRYNNANFRNMITCPITMEIMDNPVSISDGSTYERAAIEQWFRTQRTSPLTGMLSDTTLRPNLLVRGIIEEFRNAQNN